MDVEDIKQILSMLRAEYGTKVICTVERVKVWKMMLGAYDRNDVVLAVAELMGEARQFPPTVGEINQKVIQNKIGIQEDWSSLWDAVMRAGNRSLYHAAEEADKLPKRALRAIGGVEGLKELARSSTDNISTIRAQFRQRLEAVDSREDVIATKDSLLKALPNVSVNVKKIG